MYFSKLKYNNDQYENKFQTVVTVNSNTSPFINFKVFLLKEYK